MDVRAVTNAWLISRQQGPLPIEQQPQCREERSADRDALLDDDADDDVAITIEKRDDFVPRRRGRQIGSPKTDGFWSNALFWKGIVFGLLAVVLVKMALDVHAPFGVDWYVY